MRRFRIITELSAATTYGLALALIFGIALFLRTYFPYENVFAGDWVRFQINDPWFHMRLVENLVQHFPHLTSFDPYTFYPHGLIPNIAPLFDLLLGFFIWAIGLGSPSKQMIDTVGAYFPAILGALVTIPVYFIGKELFNSKVGLLAAALIAISPGQFMLRTLLGFTDHHVAEILFSTLTMLFLILAVKNSKQKELSFDSLWHRNWGSIRQPLIYSLLIGVALGCYLLSWVGGGLLIFIIFAYAIIQYIIDHLRGRSTDYLCMIGVLSFLIALLMIAPVSGRYAMGELQVASLLIGMLAFLALSGVSFLMARRKIRRAYYPLALAGLGVIGLTGFYLINPTLLESILDKLNVVRPAGGTLTISEAKPLFSSGGISSAWDQFTTGFFLAPISLILVAYLVVRKGDADKTLLLVWSVLILIATLGQNRFSYYFAVNVALLTANLSWKLLKLGGYREASKDMNSEEADSRIRLGKESETARYSKETKRKKGKAGRRETGASATRYRARYVYGMIAIIVVFFLAFYPNIGKAIDWASPQRGATDDWHESLVWMRENTPDPFQDPDFYYELYEAPAAEESYKYYPQSAYGVMSWWDYGYWITYIAHRIPNTIPGQAGAELAASFFTAPDESSANEILDRLGSKYVIIDYQMAIGLRVKVGDQEAITRWKFYAMARYAGRTESDFYGLYYQRGQAGAIRLFYPEYYQSMVSRLYNFGGRKWDPYDDWIKDTWDDEIEDYRNKINVISYEVSRDGKEIEYKIITDVQTFTTYERAKAFLEANPGYIIVGTDRLLSPVPLEELEHYKLVYKSPATIVTRGEDRISNVEIFEYLP